MKVILASPRHHRSVFPEPSASSPATTKTPKPSPKSPDARSHFGRPGLRVGAGAWLPRRSARPATQVAGQALRRALFYRGHGLHSGRCRLALKSDSAGSPTDTGRCSLYPLSPREVVLVAQQQQRHNTDRSKVHPPGTPLTSSPRMSHWLPTTGNGKGQTDGHRTGSDSAVFFANPTSSGFPQRSTSLHPLGISPPSTGTEAHPGRGPGHPRRGNTNTNCAHTQPGPTRTSARELVGHVTTVTEL